MPPFWAPQLAATAYAKGLLFITNREPEIKAELESGSKGYILSNKKTQINKQRSVLRSKADFLY